MEITRVFDLLPYALTNLARPDLLNHKKDGKYVPVATTEVVNRIRQLALGLIAIGLKPGEKVAIISPSRLEWTIIDFALQQAGCIGIPIYPTITATEYHYIFENAEVCAVVAGNAEILEKVNEAMKGLDFVRTIFSFDNLPGTVPLDRLANDDNEKYTDEMQNRMAAIKPSDLLTIIYTSGTTGLPKGVMLTHNNVVSNFTDCLSAVPVNREDRILTFLPLCHIFERTIVFLFIRVGCGIYYAESMETIVANLKEVKPHIFTTVPRLLEKVYERIEVKGLELKGIKRSIFDWALKLGFQYELPNRKGLWYNLQLSIARKLVFSKWREALGGNIVAIVSGSAALQPRLTRVFWAAGIPIMEGYGLTETSPVVCVNRINEADNRVGTIGLLIDNVQVKLASDGEILVKGPNIMAGYYKNPELTAEVIDKDGWFKTGDIGEMLEGRFLKITDRKKEMFKTSGGKYIAPQYIENIIKESLYVEQVMVVGEGQKFAAALIVPNFKSLAEWCKLHHVTINSDLEMVTNKAVITKFQQEIDKFNLRLSQTEKIKKFALMPASWTSDGGELTPTFKLRRKPILQKYAKEIEGLFKD